MAAPEFEWIEDAKQDEDTPERIEKKTTFLTFQFVLQGLEKMEEAEELQESAE